MKPLSNVTMLILSNIILIVVAVMAFFMNMYTDQHWLLMVLSVATGLATALLPFSLLFGLRALSARNDVHEKPERTRLAAKLLSVLLLITIFIGTRAMIYSFWMEPDHGKFVYENTGRISLFLSILLMTLLSAVQKDIYWFNRKSQIKFDERQIRERQRVFEKSYTIAAWTVLIVALVTCANTDSIDNTIKHVLEFEFGHKLPGDFYIPLYNLVIFLFSLPLIIAAWDREKAERPKKV